MSQNCLGSPYNNRDTSLYVLSNFIQIHSYISVTSYGNLTGFLLQSYCADSSITNSSKVVRKITYHIDVACPYHNLQNCSSLSISQFLENDLKNGAMQFTRNSKWSCVSISFVAAVWLTNGLSMGTYTLNILWTPLMIRYFSIFFIFLCMRYYFSKYVVYGIDDANSKIIGSMLIRMV